MTTTIVFCLGVLLLCWNSGGGLLHFSVQGPTVSCNIHVHVWWQMCLLMCHCSPDWSWWLLNRLDRRESSSCVPPTPPCSTPPTGHEDFLPRLCTHWDVNRLVPWSSRPPLLSLCSSHLCLDLLPCSGPSQPSTYLWFRKCLLLDNLPLVLFKWCDARLKMSHIYLNS